jgi:WD40 repeat protein
MGTPGYMAPEQLRNAPDDVGPRADVYALGAILYEMLTGRPPFDAATPLETIGQLLSQEPLSPAQLRPRLPADLATVCLKCLEKSRGLRYASALDLAEDLRRFRSGEPVTARPVGPLGRAYRWCRRRPLVAGLAALSTVLALALIATAAWYQVRLRQALARKVEDERQEIVQLDIALAVMEKADGDAFMAILWRAEAMRSDEEAGAGGSDQRAWIAATLGRCPRLLQLRTRNERVVCARPTPSGAWVVTVAADKAMRVWDAVSGDPRGSELTFDEAPVGAALSADGRFLAAIGERGEVRVWDVLSGESRPLPAGAAAVRRVAFPAGDDVLLTEGPDRIALWDLRSDPPKPLPSPWDDGTTYTALGDDARWLFTQDGERRGRVWDMATCKAVGSPVPVGRRVTLAAVSADGLRVALLGEDGALRVWDGSAGAWLDGPMHPRGNVNRLWFCPDGERVISAGGDPGAQLWRVQTGESLDLPSRKGATEAALHFSPDGRLLVARQGTWARVWDTQRGRAVTPPLRHGSPVVAAAFRAEGREVVTVSATGTVRVWELPALDEDEGAAGRDDRPTAEIIAWAHLLSCARINAKQQQEALDDEKLRAEWEALMNR